MPRQALAPRLIILSGPVGSGKSTQKNAIIHILRRRGHKATGVYLKSLNLLSHGAVAFVSMVAGVRRDDKRSLWRVLVEERKHLVKKIFSILSLLDLISMSVKFLLNVYVPLLVGRFVVVEEYFPSTLLDYILFRKMGLRSRFDNIIVVLAQRYHSIVAERSCFIYLYASESTLKRRWESRGTYERDEYLHLQQRMLKKIINQFDRRCYVEISTEEPLSLTTRRIARMLGI